MRRKSSDLREWRKSSKR